MRFFSTFLLMYISIGVLLFVSGCSTVRPVRTKPVAIYTVKEGDTFIRIASRYGVSVTEISTLNPGLNERNLKPGQKIEMPESLLGPEPGQRGSAGWQNRFSDPRYEILGPARGFVGAMAWPVSGARGISSNFGKRRTSFHEGLDVSGKPGLPIYAAHTGRVVYSGNSKRGYGNMIILIANGMATVYAHNRHNLVSRGDIVTRGQHIAELGQTGRATGPHLHFETRIRNREGRYVAVNPLLFYPL
jgi:murein DD-endopeptidase MepM/ murein hydrolase activator NlpD